MTQQSEQRSRLLSPGYRRIFISTMFTVCFFNFADRAVFSVLAQTIKVDLKLTDLELGLLQGLAFALLYAAVGLPIGRLAENHSRLKIVATATAFWSAATVATGFANNFVHLMIARLAVGMGEAGFVPPTSSLVSDMVPRHKRASTMSLIMLGTPVGLFAGSIIAGAVAQDYGWRTAFWVLGLPGLVVAAVVVLLLREPTRGLVDGTPPPTTPTPSFGTFLKKLRSNRALCLVIAGGALTGFGMTSISQFLAVFLARVHEMDVREAGAFYGAISGVSLTIGLLAGSFGTDWLSRKDARWPAWGAAIGLSLAPFFYWAAFSADSKFSATVLLILSGSTLLLFFGPTAGMIQNLLEPRMRATGAALYAMLYTIIGSGLGPVFVGFVSDKMASRAFSGNYMASCPNGLPPDNASAALAKSCEVASATGVQQALMLSVCIFFLSAAI